ncbi:hypothetical protein CMUS01_10040 [Colletotrichum musicola]|uniref:Uncharacterized protein n=1 Tax=Colletotrichum musicola TaxID=2175873 RepID=A0A8H6N9X7_9PEZI|nr:hypothetical protein CMUS01_10040 [Colletotrichum musicola]
MDMAEVTGKSKPSLRLPTSGVVVTRLSDGVKVVGRRAEGGKAWAKSRAYNARTLSTTRKQLRIRGISSSPGRAGVPVPHTARSDVAVSKDPAKYIH